MEQISSPTSSFIDFDFGMILKWKRANKTETTNEQK